MIVYEHIIKNSVEVPDKTAIRSDGINITYEELYKLIENTVAYLSKLGVVKQKVVTIITSDILTYTTYYFAVTRLGAILNPLNPQVTSSEINRILESLKPHFILVDDLNMDKILNLSNDEEKTFPQIIRTEFTGELEPVELVLPLPTDYMIVYLSSGTTKLPKLVWLTHDTLTEAALTLQSRYSVNEADSIYFAVPLTHLYGGSGLLSCGLVSKATLHIDTTFKIGSIVPFLIENKITLIGGVPTHFNYLVNYVKNLDIDNTKLSLRGALTAGGVISEDTATSFMKAFNCKLYNLYGTTESGFIAAVPLNDDYYQNSVGKTGEKVQAEIINENGEKLDVGQEGELRIRSEYIKPYYLIEGELISGLKDGWLYTGDLAKIDANGRLYILGRVSDLIITGGFNVNPIEVEEVIKLHKNVKEASVLGIQDSILGEIVSAAVIPYENDDNLINEVYELCKENLISYKNPKIICVTNEFPKTPLGKVKKNELRKIIQSST